MKTALTRSISVLALFALTLLVSVTATLSRQARQLQTAAITQSQAGPVIAGNGYGEVLNGLFATGGR